MQQDDTTRTEAREVTRVREAIAKWRKEPGRTRGMPDALWDMAVGLSGSIGIGRTSSILGLNYTVLKRRLEARPKRGVRTVRPRFVEIGLTPAPGLDCRVELEQGGRRIGIALKGARPDDVATLIRRLEAAP